MPASRADPYFVAGSRHCLHRCVFDLPTRADAAGGLRGIDAVVLAVGGYEVTVDYRAAMLWAAVAGGVARSVYLSSITVYDHADGTTVEQADFVPFHEREHAPWKLAAGRGCVKAHGLNVFAEPSRLRLGSALVGGDGGSISPLRTIEAVLNLWGGHMQLCML